MDELEKVVLVSNGKAVGGGGGSVTDAKNVKYNDSNVKDELDAVNVKLVRKKYIMDVTTDAAGNIKVWESDKTLISAYITDSNKFYFCVPWFSLDDNSWYIRVMDGGNVATIPNVSISKLFYTYITD